VRGSKDLGLAFAARTYVNARLRGIGEMTELSIDTKKRTIRLSLALLGEVEPIEVQVRKYALERADTGTRLTIVDVTASRQWLAEALKEFIVGRSFAIPDQAAAALKLLA
jgi:hypothetical protein